MFAARAGNVECVKLLLDEVKMQNNEGNTALYIAVSYNHEACVEVLAKHESCIRNQN